MLSVSVLAALASVAGAVLVTTARDSRLAVLGLMTATIASSFVASPFPGSLAVTARVLGAILAAYLLWTAASAAPTGNSGSILGPVAEACAAVAAYLLGLAIRPVDPLGGLPEAQAAGLAVLVLAVAPLASRDALRVGMGVLLLALGGSLIIAAWSGQPGGALQPPDLEQFIVAVLLVGVAGATSLLVPATSRFAAAVEFEPEQAATPKPAFPILAASRPAAVRPVAPRPAAPRPAAPRPAESAPAAADWLWQGADEQPAGSPADSPPVTPPVTPSPTPSTSAAPPPQARPRPMTADPIEPDEWAAWQAPEPERPEPRHGSRGQQAHRVPKDRR